MEGNRNLYLFDFDGTLTNVDTLFDFLKISFSKTYKLRFIQFLPQFIGAKLGINSKAEVKRMFINSFIEGKSRSEIESLANQYFQQKSQKILRKSAMSYIQNLPSNDAKFIVSASLDIWLKPFAEFLGLDLICTHAEFDTNGNYTGRFATPNCNYLEKKNRILQEIHIDDYDEIFAFGDTKGDLEMFSLAHHIFFKKF